MNDQNILAIIEIAAAAGFSATYNAAAEMFSFVERDSGVEIMSVLQGDDDDETRILYNQMIVGTISDKNIVAEQDYRDLMTMLIGATNGISTSSFQINNLENGDIQVLLNNYAPIQDLGNDDCADITFTLQALISDLMAAMSMLETYMGTPQQTMAAGA